MNLTNTRANKPNGGQTYFSVFDKAYPYNKIKRVVANKNTGEILRVLSDEDSNYTIFGQPINLDTTTEMICVYYPPFYRKKNCRIDGVEKQGIALNVIPDKYGTNCPDGYTIEDWFLNEDGTIAPYRMLGAFDGYVDSDGQLTSIPYVIPTRSKNIQQFRDYAKVNRESDRAGIISFYAVSAIQRLFVMEFGSFDSQSALGKGKTYLSSDNDVVASDYDILKTGETMELGNRSGYLNRTYNGEELSDGKVSISYRGLEDFFGNVWQFVDGLVIIDTGYYFTNSLDKMAQIKSDNVLNVDGWNYFATTVPTTNGYVSKMYEGDLDFSFFSKEVNGSSSTYYCDYRYSYNGGGALRVARFGGGWDGASHAGAFYWHLDANATISYWSVFSRLESRL